MQKIESEINRLINIFQKDQLPDGSWDYPFETGIVTDCYMIILLRLLDKEDETLIHSLANRIIKKQRPNGSWSLFHDEGDGNLSATIEAYYALLFSGLMLEQNPKMQLAKTFIISQGGLHQANTFTKIMLAISGQYKWPENIQIPIEFILLPNSFLVNLFDVSVFCRANFVPILMLADYKYTINRSDTPDLSDLMEKRESKLDFSDDLNYRSIVNLIQEGIESLMSLPKEAHEAALSKAEQYMMGRIEPDGTLLSYFSATFLMVFAMLARGYKKEHPIITHAIQGLKSMVCTIDGDNHVQYTTANVWNTTLISYALQEAGIGYQESVVQKANHYILSWQHTKLGDWAIHNSRALPGGWGFSHINTMNPDVDDTSAALRAFRSAAQNNHTYLQSWKLGIQWIISMQNRDGGWPAFERNVNKHFLTWLPIEEAEDILIDPSSADLTGRTLHFLGESTTLKKDHPIMKQGINWLLDHQENAGYWPGRWGIYYLYGTWAAITGMVSAGVNIKHPAIQKALRWILTIQNKDGGWGESCRSDIKKQYIPLTTSTRTHTAWALDALIAASKRVTPEIRKGIDFLTSNNEQEDWVHHYPNGKGMAGAFYIHYHSYDLIWPLLTLSHYQKKFG
ncbi:terpene cyclase/mutase family protein [Terrilactibacillus laevilacticus]|uniref:Prenyltransferase/squalene oxidase repeat-containing protein n=1 Tax=Terrilactibacillus laevilacticus TaxID=1380157 RepID=A0ABW5PPA6_9BACI|nr:prenyltransferase/squalene oxidase repeat-containing protein [Terrilactibacillus laevilacticus]